MYIVATSRVNLIFANMKTNCTALNRATYQHLCFDAVTLWIVQSLYLLISNFKSLTILLWPYTVQFVSYLVRNTEDRLSTVLYIVAVMILR